VRAERELRQQRILSSIREQGQARVTELCRLFDASEATIRRDLEELDEAGLVKRIHGGAILTQEAADESAILQRLEKDGAQKRLIAQAAASMVRDGDTIFLGSGSTILYMLPFMKERKGITVVTNSLPVISRLIEFPDFKTVVVGGVVRKSELSFVGHISVRTLEELRADKVFLGIEAIHLDHGLTNSFPEETMTDRAIVQISSKVVMLADYSKFNKVHASYWGPLNMMQVIITDWMTDESVIEQLKAAGVQVVVVQPENNE